MSFSRSLTCRVLCASIFVWSSVSIAENGRGSTGYIEFSSYERSLRRETGCLIVGHRQGLDLNQENREAHTNGAARAQLPSPEIGSLTSHGDYRIKRLLLDGAVTVIRYETPIGKEEDVCEELMSSGLFNYVEPNYLIEEAAIPDDTYYSSQWHHAKVSAPEAWNYGTGNPSVLVAVCDSGFEVGHLDLAGNLQLPGYNAVDESDNVGPYLPPGVDHPHGTRVAGVLGAIGNNASDVAGTVWSTRVLPIKIAHVVVNGSSFATPENAAAGIEYAADHDARVVNLSYGMAHRQLIKDAGQYLRERDGLLFVSAGNSGNNWGSSHDYASFVAVGATDEFDSHCQFSNYGSFIDVVAPGTNICTLDLNGQVRIGSWGTSYSSPIVAGIAALLWSYDSDLTPSEVENLIFDSCVDIGVPGEDIYYGHGRVDAEEALRLLHNTRIPESFSLAADFDGDGTKDPAVYDPDTSTFYYIGSTDLRDHSQSWGMAGDIPVPGDYDGSGPDNFAVFRPSTATWFIRPDGGGPPIQYQFGDPNDSLTPAPLDYDGDGIMDCAVVSQTTYQWFIRRSDGSGTVIKQHGLVGDIVAPGHFDSVAGAELAVYRPSNFSWYWRSAVLAVNGTKLFGAAGRVPAPADYNGDGKDDWCVYDPGTEDWHIELNGGGSANELDFGDGARAIPIPADYDGDGMADVAFVDGTSGKWHVKRSSDGELLVMPPALFGWHEGGDIPVPAGYTIPQSTGCNLAVYRSTTSTWYVRAINDGDPTTSQSWGTVPSTPVRGDFDADGYCDFGCVGNSDYVWRIKTSGTGPDISQPFGVVGDELVPGDYDGDGITDIAVYRMSDGVNDSMWYIRKGDGSGRMDTPFGWVNDQPVLGDFDGDGATDISVFRPSNGMWYIKASSGGRLDQQFGWTGYLTVPGDYDGDGKSDVAVFFPPTGMWSIKKSDGTGRIDQVWGEPTDTPVPADYDLDGKTDIAVYREGEWHILRSSDGKKMAGRGPFFHGIPGDLIIGGRKTPRY